MTRRQRKAAATESPAAETAASIPLATPAYGSNEKQQSKTLYEIAAERQEQLSSRAPQFSKLPAKEEDVRYLKITSDGTFQETNIEGGRGLPRAQEEDSPLLDTLFLASSLCALHFTLTVLTVHQYAQDLHFPPIIKNTLFVAFPTLAFAIHLFHGHLFPRVLLSSSANVVDGVLKVVQQIGFLLVANIAGCYLIHLTNDEGYYAIMKRAPSIGTVWVWCIVELGLLGALAGVAGPGIYAWHKGYGVL